MGMFKPSQKTQQYRCYTSFYRRFNVSANSYERDNKEMDVFVVRPDRNLASLALLAVIPTGEGAVPELRGSLLEKIFFAIETQHGVAHLSFPNYDQISGGYSLQSILDEGNGYIGDYSVHVVS